MTTSTTDGVRLLGPLEFRWAGAPVPLPRRQQRLLLGVLALSANRIVSLERLIEVFWPEGPPEGGRRQIQVLVSRLRGLLTPAGEQAVVLATGSGYGLRIDPMVVDAHRFTVLTERAGAGAGDEEKADLLRQALDLWRGPVLPEADPGAARDTLCVALEEARCEAVEEYAEASLRLGRHRRLLGRLAEEVAANPVRERLAGLLMLALHRSGRVPDALDAFERLREHLAGELGIDPSPDLVRLHRRILSGDPGLGPSTGSGSILRRAGPTGSPGMWTGDPEGEGLVMLGLGRLRFAQDRFAESLAAYEQAGRVFKHLGDRRHLASALDGTGTVLAKSGSFEAGEANLLEAASIFSYLGDLGGRAHAVYLLGFVERERGNDESALRLLHRALATYRKIGDRRGEALLQRSVGLVHRARREYRQAMVRTRTSRRLLAALPDPHGVAYADQSLAKIQIRMGDLRPAEAALLSSLSVCTHQGDRFGRALGLRTLGELRLEQGAITDARTALADALVLWDTLELPLWRARTLHVLAELERRYGDAAEADAARRESAAVFRRLGSREGR
ncbi:BTAD domain-containing putative transcriptional regulator [Rhizohabitans arisaemae]|uniref:BTAD domain-containing putative transcriptional regulator n=1 Tax=Rhizohabitans arisaemae TaxID=2720610 RepID=UPI0024B23DE5|nr:BTAD domain-containing putative transcriptional regulator [Rhizohabitans arisaemae]